MNPNKFKQLVSEVPEYRRRLFHRQGRIANQVRAYLDETGKNQVWLSEKSGIAEPVLSRVMMGTSNLTLETIAKIESVFKKDIQLTALEYAEKQVLMQAATTRSQAMASAVQSFDSEKSWGVLYVGTETNKVSTYLKVGPAFVGTKAEMVKAARKVARPDFAQSAQALYNRYQPV